MNKSIAQALASLLPTLNAPPPALLDLSASFLAQSRSKASNLKPEEETARTYACAHLACERLKQSLNLPLFQPRPPCSPRIYKKLLQYLSNALPGQGPRTPKKQRTGTQNNALDTPSPSKSLQKTTKIKNPPVQTPNSTRSTARKRKMKEFEQHFDEKDVPEWSMPAIRHLCKTLEVPAASPHVYAGLCSVLGAINLENMTMSTGEDATSRPAGSSSSNPSAPKRDQESARVFSKDDVVAALIVVLYLYTMTRLSPSDISQEYYVNHKTRAIDAIQKTHTSNSIKRQSFDLLIEKLIREAQSGWLELEWFSNIPEGQGLTTISAFAALVDGTGADQNGGITAFSEAERYVSEAEATGPEAVRLEHGLGSMFVGAIDYLSEERRRDYRTWKANMMEKIEAIESQQAVDAS